MGNGNGALLKGDPNKVTNEKGNTRVPYAFAGGLVLIKIPKTIEKLQASAETIIKDKSNDKATTEKKNKGNDGGRVQLARVATYPHESGVTHIELG